MKITDKTICIIDPAGPWLWDFYETQGQAEKKCTELNDELELTGAERVYFIGIIETFEDMQREKYLTGEVHVIDKAKFWEMLEILPPLRWKNNGVIETFCMSEFMASTFTEQYGRYGDKYISKMIDYNDESTEIKIADFAE